MALNVFSRSFKVNIRQRCKQDFFVKTKIKTKKGTKAKCVKVCEYHNNQFVHRESKKESPYSTSYLHNLPEYLRDPELSIDNFRRQLKTFLFAQY